MIIQDWLNCIRTRLGWNRVSRKVRQPRQRWSLERLEDRALLSAFTPGDLVIYRVGDGSGNLLNTGNQVFLDEYTPGGTLVQSIALPSTGSGNKLIASGTATSEGLLSLAADGQSVVLTGYNTTVGGSSLSGTTASAVPRIVGIVDIAGNIDVSTSTNASSGNNPRSAVRDGNNVWIVGGAGGVQYVSLGGSTVTQINTSGTSLTNIRAVEIFNGQLYVSTGSGSAFRIATVGTGEPTSTGTSLTNLPGFSTSGSQYQFFLARVGSGTAFNGYDTLYVADDSPGTIQKWTYDGSNWNAAGSVTASGVRGLTGIVSGTTVNIYGTTGASTASGGGTIYLLSDSSSFGTSISGSATAVTSLPGSSNQAFRGVVVSPDDGIGAVTGLNGTTNYNAGDAATIVNASAAFSDSSNFKGGWLTISFASGGTGAETLSINNVGTGAGQISFDGTTVKYGNVTIGTKDSTLNGASGASLRIKFNDVSSSTGDVLAAAIQALLRQITFSTTSGAAAGDRVLSFQVQQNDGKASTINAAAQQTLHVTATSSNQAPTDLALSAATVAENQPVGTAIGTFTTTDPNSGDTFTYTLVTGSGSTDNAKFQISGSELQTNAVLDFEAQPTYSIRVRTTDAGGLTFEKSFTITATNVNEDPTDLALSASTVAENQPVGTAVGSFSTTDPDASDTFTYTLVTGSGSTDNAKFQISGSQLQTNAVLDFEAQPTYSIRVRTTDAGGLTFEKSFTITATNVNEDPTDLALSASTVAENQPVGTAIGTFSTTDPDVGDTLTYTLVTGSGSNDNLLFQISGSELQTNAVLDFEAQPTYSIRVRTTDAGGLTFEKSFTITATNVNEDPTDLALSNNSVAENKPVGTAVGTFSSTDPDAGDSFTYTLVAGSGSVDNPSFQIVGDELRSNVIFDYSVQSTYSIRVRTTDAGGLSFEQSFSITITQSNADPTDISLSASSVAENQPSGTAVGTFSTTDPDSGDTFTYTLVTGSGSADNSQFQISGSELQTNAVLDFETQPSYSIRVRTTDRGGLTFEKSFTITATNVNEPPTDLALSANSVPENQPVGTTVGTLTTTDPDDSDTFTYTLVSGSGSTDNGLFQISGSQLQTNAVFDYEAGASYSVRVRTTDAGGLSFETSFTITISNVNEDPTDLQLSANTIPEGKPVGTAIGTFASTDPDTAETFTYTLVSGAGSGDNTLFKLVGNELQSNAVFDFETQSVYSIRVRTTDAGGLWFEQAFTINVTDVNDVPSFVKGADQNVLEDSGLHTVSGWATAISAGAGETGQLLDFLVSNDNNSLFTVQPAVAADGTLTYTLAPNADGSATVTVALHDNGGTADGGIDTSASQTFTISVTAVNDVPGFTKGSNQSVLEDSGLHTVSGWATAISAGPADEAGQVLNFLVNNTNNSLFSVQPAIAADGTLTYTLAANANGSATVTVALHDNGGVANGGVDTSAAQTFTISVTAVNDAPSFTKGANQVVLEDSGAHSIAGWATAISAGPADEAGQALNFIVSNDNNSLFSVQPAIAANGTLTYTLAANANGIATVTVALHDNGGLANGGVDTSAGQTFTISVTAVNDAPSFTKGADESVLEDSGLHTVTGWATGISAGPADEAGQVLDFQVSNTNNSLFSIQPAIAANGTLTYTLAANANGSATVTVALHDNGGTANGGSDTSASQTFTITVTPVNDVPSFTKGANENVLEDSGAHSVTGWATGLSTGPANEAGQTLDFLVSNDNNGLFSVQPVISANGTLTYTLAANANGVATVTVAIHDNGGTANGGVDTSATQTFTISVTAVNDAPSFTKGLDQDVLEDSGVHTVAGWATALSAGPADEAGQALNFVVSNDNNGLFSIQPAIAADGTLTFTPAADAYGTATVTVTLHDNGGVANGGVDTSVVQTLLITVEPVNDVPSFTKGADQVVLEDAGLQTVAGWATGILAGPANESGQLLDFIVTNDNNALFSVQPAIAADGTLTFTPALNAVGTALVSVRLHDNGGVDFSGNDTSAVQTFLITVTPVNDAPTFTPGTDQVVLEDAGAQTDTGWATGISAGPADEAGQTVTFSVSNDNNGLFSVQPTLAADGTLTFTPAANAYGTAVVTVTLSDDGGTADGGSDTGSVVSFTITVLPVNDAPSFVPGSDQAVLEDSGLRTVTGWATSLSTGPANEAAQVLNFVVTNDNNALFSVQPTLAADGTLTFTPAANANGTATVTVVLQDDGGTDNGGSDSSAAITFTITVTSVNDAPTFKAGADEIVLEDAGLQTIADWATQISAGPADEAGQTLNFTVTNDNNSLFSVQPTLAADGTLTYTPAANANGSATVTVVLHDNGGTANGGVDTSVTRTFTITVLAVNDAPSFTRGADQTVLEDSGAKTVTGWATAISAGPTNEAGQTLSFVVTNDNNSLFSVQPTVSANGTLTFTPAANANGTATVTVTLLDNGGSDNGGADASSVQTFVITVTAVNDAPSFLMLGDQSILEDAGAQTVAGFITAMSAGPANEAAQTLQFLISNDNGSLFAVQPFITATGDLSYTLAPNANGTAIVTLQLQDNGGTANGGSDTSAAQTFRLVVTSVNDAPTFTLSGDVNIPEDTPSPSVANFATSISAGAADEAGQTLTFLLTNDNPGLFTVAPAISASGTLTFTLAPNANGVAHVSVVLTDNGGTNNGGFDSTVAQTFTLTILPVNDAPTFVVGPNQTALEDSGTQTVAGFITGTSTGPADEAGQTYSFALTNNNAALFSIAPAISPAGVLTYTLAPNANGTATVTVTMLDDGGSANGGTSASIPRTFTITVTPVNDLPSFQVGSNITVLEDAAPQVVAGYISNISVGPANETGQTVQFQVTNNNPALFSVAPAINAAGVLTYTLAPNVNGTATVTVSMRDSGGTDNGGVDSTASQSFTITTTPVNDAPSFQVGGNLTVLEDAGPQTVPGFNTAISTGPADEAGQTVLFQVTNNRPSLFAVQPAISPNGTLTYTLAPNAVGSAVVTVTLQDSGGVANGGVNISSPQSFTISVTPVNDPPTFELAGNHTLPEDSLGQTIQNFAGLITAGPSDETGQTWFFTVTNDNPGLFSSQPVLSPTGTLTYTPAPNAYGSATVTVILQDNGGTANGGVNTSAPVTFVIQITPVDDAPSFRAGSGDLTVDEDFGPYSATWATNISAGPANEAGQQLTFVITNNNPDLFAVQPAIAANGRLTFTPAANVSGTAMLMIFLQDDGGSTGGVDHSATMVLTIHVRPVDDPLQILPEAAPPVIYVPGTDGVVIDSQMTVVDVDTPNIDFSFGRLVVDLEGTASKLDRLFLPKLSQGVLSGEVAVKGKKVFLDGQEIGHLSGGKKGSPLEIDFYAGLTEADVAAILQAVSFRTKDGKNSSTMDRTVQFAVQNQLGTEQAQTVRTIHIETPLSAGRRHQAGKKK